MVISKDSPLHEFLNYQIIRFMETGIYKRIVNQDSQVQTSCADNSEKWKAPNIKKTISLFLILLFGFGCSLLCFVVELTKPKWLDHFHEKSKSRSKSEMSKELQLLINKLIQFQAEMEHFDSYELDEHHNRFVLLHNIENGD